MNKLQKEKFSLRMALEKDWEPAMNLAWETFLVFEAAEYSKEGIESFRDFISDQWLKNMFLKGEYQMVVALDREKIIGFITLRNRCQLPAYGNFYLQKAKKYDTGFLTL